MVDSSSADVHVENAVVVIFDSCSKRLFLHRICYLLMCIGARGTPHLFLHAVCTVSQVRHIVRMPAHQNARVQFVLFASIWISGFMGARCGPVRSYRLLQELRSSIVHEMGARCVCVRARVHLCRYCIGTWMRALPACARRFHGTCLITWLLQSRELVHNTIT